VLILLPAECHRVLLRNCFRGSPVHSALQQSKTMGDTIVPVDQYAVICDQATAEELLRIASSHCPEAVPILLEAVESGKR
jgi:hypothetical protein